MLPALMLITIASMPATQATFEWSDQTGIQFLAGWEDLLLVPATKAVNCDCTPLEALHIMFADRATELHVINDHTVTFITNYCTPWRDPEWATLPPCKPRPLEIRIPGERVPFDVVPPASPGTLPVRPPPPEGTHPPTRTAAALSVPSPPPADSRRSA